MFPAIRETIRPENASGSRRIFVTEAMGDGLLHDLLSEVVSIYCTVTGNGEIDNYGGDSAVARIQHHIRESQPGGIRQSREFLFGMDRLPPPARDNGRLLVRDIGIVVPIRAERQRLHGTAFSADTSDHVNRRRPAASIEVSREFAAAIVEIADSTFADFSVPLPVGKGNIIYDPAMD